VAKAVAAGAVLWEQTVVTKLERDKDSSVHRVQFATYGKATTKGRAISPVTADVVVIAANAIETPKLLLVSDLANKSGKVGWYLMDHLSKSTFGRIPEPLFPFRGPPSTSGIESFRDGDFRKEYAGFRVSLNNDGWSRKGAPYADIIDLVTNEKRIGTDLQGALFARVVGQLRLSCSVEVAPDPNNRVELSTTTDPLGVPHPKITFKAPPYSLTGLAHATNAMKHIFEILGEPNPDLGVEGAFDGAGHIMGTCRMGNDPSSSVVDGDCCSHDHSNLFILGSTVFPTCGSPNPTLTIAALALRGADHIAKKLGLKTAPTE
jgi:choline dehydrogenase-like flavoprotein